MVCVIDILLLTYLYHWTMLARSQGCPVPMNQCIIGSVKLTAYNLSLGVIALGVLWPGPMSEYCTHVMHQLLTNALGVASVAVEELIQWPWATGACCDHVLIGTNPRATWLWNMCLYVSENGAKLSYQKSHHTNLGIHSNREANWEYRIHPICDCWYFWVPHCSTVKSPPVQFLPSRRLT